jgi:CMP/dCMP kinase
MGKKMIIAIDGYSSCGKSTLAKSLARRLSYAYVDTGAMYRAVSLYFIENKVQTSEPEQIRAALDNISISFRLNSERGVSEVYLNGRNVEREIRMMPVADNVSRVSSIREVRRRMVALQKEMGRDKGIVMDGRDIGTAVFPGADLKLFMTADADVRTLRRYKELKSKGMEIPLEDVKQNLAKRDFEDTNRQESPLTMAEDAVILDNTHLSEEDQLDFVMKLVDKKKHALANISS